MDKILKFKVGIEGLENKIWRVIEITNRMTVADLAYTILASFNSLAYHLYKIMIIFMIVELIPKKLNMMRIK